MQRGDGTTHAASSPDKTPHGGERGGGGLISYFKPLTNQPNLLRNSLLTCRPNITRWHPPPSVSAETERRNGHTPRQIKIKNNKNMQTRSHQEREWSVPPSPHQTCCISTAASQSRRTGILRAHATKTNNPKLKIKSNQTPDLIYVPILTKSGIVRHTQTHAQGTQT